MSPVVHSFDKDISHNECVEISSLRDLHVFSVKSYDHRIQSGQWPVWGGVLLLRDKNKVLILIGKAAGCCCMIGLEKLTSHCFWAKISVFGQRSSSSFALGTAVIK